MYQADQQGSAVPIVPPDELRQDVASSMGGGILVQQLSSISQKHVSHDIAGCLMLLHRFTSAGCHKAALSHLSHIDDVLYLPFVACEMKPKNVDGAQLASE